VKHSESPDSVIARVGAVESCWLSDRQDEQADSAVGSLKEKRVISGGLLTRRVRSVGVYFEVTGSSEEVSSGRDDVANVMKAADRVTELVACRRLVGDHFEDVGRPFFILVCR
jgi:hypothetical protein